MPQAEPSSPKAPERKSPLASLPTALTAVAGLIAALATMLTALHNTGVLRPATPTAAPPAVVSPAATEPPPTMAAMVTPTATATRPPQTVTEGFGQGCGGWASHVSDEAQLGCAGEEYRIAVHEIGSDWHVTSPWERRPVDLVAEVDARRVEGLDDNVYGLILRVQPNEDDFYLFAVSSDGQYSVQIRQGGAWQVLQDWEVASAVRGGDQSNHLRVECLGPQMRFWVNEQPVADVQDSTFASGSVGLLAGAGPTQDSAVVHFDNLRLLVVSE
ncbi:MAG: hypothetical protein GX605_08525 [Chloroflexi bacterium]|nr:hypothetical protein [Chloroflexota bacterium]